MYCMHCIHTHTHSYTFWHSIQLIKNYAVLEVSCPTLKKPDTETFFGVEPRFSITATRTCSNDGLFLDGMAEETVKCIANGLNGIWHRNDSTCGSKYVNCKNARLQSQTRANAEPLHHFQWKDVMGAISGYGTVKFRSCNNLWSSVHITPLSVLHSVGLKIKRQLLSLKLLMLSLSSLPPLLLPLSEYFSYFLSLSWWADKVVT